MLEASLDDIGLVGEIVPVPDIDDRQTGFSMLRTFRSGS